MIFIAVTLWLMSGQVHFEQRAFPGLAECMVYGEYKIEELTAKDATVLYGACVSGQGKES